MLKFQPHLLKDLRLKMGISQERFVAEMYSRDLPLTRTTCNSWEQGDTFPGANDMPIIAEFYGVPIQYFYK